MTKSRSRAVDRGSPNYIAILCSETDGGDGGIAKFSATNGTVAYHQIPNGSAGSAFFRVSTDSTAV